MLLLHNNHSNPEQEKWRNLRINHFLGAYLGKYTFTSKNISQQKRFTHASHLQVYGRYIWPTIRAIPRTKTNCNRVWCKAIEGYLQTRLRKHFLEDRYKISFYKFIILSISQYHIQVTARPSLKPFHEFKYGSADGSQRGIILSSGNEWLDQRKFCLRKLKELGMGQRSKIDILISNEAAKLCNLLKQEIEGKFSLSLIIIIS